MNLPLAPNANSHIPNGLGVLPSGRPCRSGWLLIFMYRRLAHLAHDGTRRFCSCRCYCFCCWPGNPQNHLTRQHQRQRASEAGQSWPFQPESELESQPRCSRARTRRLCQFQINSHAHHPLLLILVLVPVAVPGHRPE